MGNLTVNVRMYQVGELGDCFFLHFKEGNKESRVLIDCGSFRNSEKSKNRLNAIVSHIYREPGIKKLDVVVGTHQHNDHVSGFVHCEQEFKGKVDQVWLSWLDDPKDPFARQVQQGQQGLIKQLMAIDAGMAGLKPTRAATTIKDMLGFCGVDEETGPSMQSTAALGLAGAAGEAKKDPPLVPAEGFRILKGLGAKDPQYLSPGKIIDLPGLPADTVKVYVLGPPRKKSLLFDKDPDKEETFDPHLAMASTFAGKFLSAVNMRANPESKKDARAEEYFPFNRSYKKTAEKIKAVTDKAAAEPDEQKKAAILQEIADVAGIKDIYEKAENDYRKIDDDWMDQGGRLALYLNSYTNNSSLVLAFELVQSRKVLLFAADAQTGNWSSWENVKWIKPRKGFTTRDLLENTVLYKVGHHASHNATLVSAFNAMKHTELVAMIPVDKTDPNIVKENGWKMPAKNLYAKLRSKTNNRVLRMDDELAEGSAPNIDKNVWTGSGLAEPVYDPDNFFIEYKIQG